LLLICQNLQAQPADSLIVEADTLIVKADTLSIDSFRLEYSPRKAAMYSAVFPGMGQIYNKKFWKAPIVYAGMGALIYSAIWNGRRYTFYFDKFQYMTETDPPLDEWEGQSLREVEWYKDSHLRYRNLFIIFSVGFYALQIVDANVDAHLIDYDISEDLTLTIDPAMLQPYDNTTTFGLRCCLNF
jgi:hypothetical protein